MMYCDFKTVTNIIYKQLVKSSVKSYSTFINMLFDSYNASCRTSKFSDSETSKLRKGKRTPTSTWVYKVRDFRRFSDAYTLIKCYYPFEMSDRKTESEIHRMASLTHRNPFLLNVCGKQLSKGVATLFSINSALCRKDYSSMKTRISTKKDGQFQEKANYHELLAKIADLSKLTDTEKYVLSYMRFIALWSSSLFLNLCAE